MQCMCVCMHGGHALRSVPPHGDPSPGVMAIRRLTLANQMLQLISLFLKKSINNPIWLDFIEFHFISSTEILTGFRRFYGIFYGSYWIFQE